MKAKEKFWELTGYRLPTEAEWEFACRADASTSRYYGETETLLTNYAWYHDNADDHAWRVARLKPNDFGLFDMLGNASEWAYGLSGSGSGYPSGSKDAAADAPNTNAVSDSDWRVMRGGSFVFGSPVVRSANRYGNLPTNQNTFYGFRPSRTYHLSP
jgi:formylglycine-generating enzyme required for sulfatase activity